MVGHGLGLWRSMIFCFMQFLGKKAISVSACYILIDRRCRDENAKKGKNIPLSYNCAIILAHLIYFLNKRSQVNPQKIRKFDAHCLFKK
jgi:hypothetical protein